MKFQQKEAKMTYHTLEQYSSFPSNDYLMICELIDNSISSYLNINYNKKQTVKGLKIHLNINRDIKDNYYLEIIDNANGMNEDQLYSCLLFGNSNREHKDSNLNIYGVGLKQSAFFIGRRLEIKTISRGSNTGIATYIDIEEIKSTEDQVVRFQLEEWNNKILTEQIDSDHGTIIKIGKLRTGKLTPKRVLEMIKSLETRYLFYLKDGLDIQINASEKGINEISSKLKPSSPLIENTNLFSEIGVESNKLIVKDIEEFGKNFLNKLKEDKKENSKIDESVLKDFVGKMLNGENFTWVIDTKILDGIKITGEISILAHHEIAKTYLGFPQNYTKYRGFALYQANRAIMCSPNEKGTGMANYVQDLIDDDISGDNNQKRRWTGYINIDNLYEAKDEKGDRKYLDLTSNKSGIQWLSEEARLAFNEIIKSHMNKYDKILNLYMSAQNETIRHEKKVDNNLKNRTEGSFNSNYIKNEFINNENMAAIFTVSLVKNGDKFIKVEIDISDSRKNEETLFDISWISKDHCDITLNSNHPIWKPILNDAITSDIVIEMYKFAIIFVLNDFVFKNLETVAEESKNVNSIFFELQKEIEGEKTPSRIISIISNRVCINV
ncbi:ATP-binding protein [Spiroplasma cantharicola]|uniref:Histidine kinase/HSP90-like ATPase domain-containing protein n=1 Tax=Spiroplasma cantharicola TaxID=362837 RepID=A0A0M4KCU0_9MOLU|nr:ATP-binding protein [Spiroplasma cantharicola]ALD66602.1 hypothetical protein SCANT_v1c06960 [Spiroplasma cantharicola]